MVRYTSWSVAHTNTALINSHCFSRWCSAYAMVWLPPESECKLFTGSFLYERFSLNWQSIVSHITVCISYIIRIKTLLFNIDLEVINMFYRFVNTIWMGQHIRTLLLHQMHNNINHVKTCSLTFETPISVNILVVYQSSLHLFFVSTDIYIYILVLLFAWHLGKSNFTISVFLCHQLKFSYT